VSEIGSIVFSGGVSEHIYDHDRNSYGDVGPLLGKYVREQLKKFSRPDLLREPNEGIRATVIGAGEYTIQASGTTSYISSATALPAFGLKVIRVPLNAQDSAAENLRQGLAKFDLPAFTSGLALAFSLDDQPDYQSIRKIAEGIVAVVRDSGVKSPVYLALDIDVAKSLGAILKEELKLAPEVIAVDGIDVGDLDYIDIGLPMGITEVIPVTVKSLMFPSTQLG
jgi:ethanolamine utilization protein EutA